MRSYTHLLIIVVVFSVVLIHSSQALDECLDNSVAVRLVNETRQFNNLTEPASNSSITLTLQTLLRILNRSTSPYAVNLAVGYPSNKYFSVYSCNNVTRPCFNISSGYFAIVVLPTRGNLQYLYEVRLSSNNTIIINLNNPIEIRSAYYPTQQPWFNANGWTAIYPMNQRLSGRTYEATQTSTNAHIASDRLSNEPCDRCLTNAPAVNYAIYLANSPFLYPTKIENTETGVLSILSTLLNQFYYPIQTGNPISSVRVGFNNGDYYSVTDCNTYVAYHQIPECQTIRFFGAVSNPRVYRNSNLRIYALNNDGQSTVNSGRDAGPFNTTSMPWFIIKSGWTDPVNVTDHNGQIVGIRTFAAPFNGGVAAVEPTTLHPFARCPQLYPAYPTPTPSPSRTFTPSPAGKYI